MGESSLWQRVRANITEVVGMCFLAVFVSAFFVGQRWLLGVGLLGMLVITPVVAFLFGDEDDVAEWWGEADRSSADADDSGRLDPLDELRSRYARGDISDDEFERHVERLLETESLDAVAEYGLLEPEDRASETAPAVESERS